ncbi:ROK family transcriptional regulator [Cohnella sp. AR92]|uniref:ROK family transcriptional regulator n=1 Tax=Cohnella sp. AR92 TaxID=648716 RepID=UPI001315930C|nr:ROK family transcriptional regulator [Cohnella sp. AR92]
MSEIKGNLQLMKEINSAVILNELHRRGTLSRAELKTITRLSATTVSSLVEELIAARMVVEVGERPSAGAGRRGIALRINGAGGYVAGLSLSGEGLRYAIMDMHGKLIASYETTNLGSGNEEIAARICEAMLDCSEKAAELKAGELKGIGVSVPGIIDEADETLVYSVHLNLKELRLKSLLEQRYPGIPVRILNDSNAAAFAEHYAGVGRGRNHLLYLLIGGGVGSGLILHGRIFAGFKGGAGEIGHIPVLRNGKLCSCGQRGCLETELSSSAILESSRQEARKLGRPIPNSAEEAVARYEAGEGSGEFRELFERSAALIAQLIATAVNFVSPEVVVLDGWMRSSQLILRRVSEELERIPFAVPVSTERLLVSKYGDSGPLYGAATFILKQLFKAPSLG